MLVYHIDYASNTVNMGDYPNNTAGHPRVTVVPADGLLISGYQTLRSDGSSQGYGGTHTQAEYSASLAGDPFPGTGGITSLNADQQIPSFYYYYKDDNGKDATEQTGVALTNITENTETGAVTFDYIVEQLGDLNRDGKVDTADITTLVDLILAQ